MPNEENEEQGDSGPDSDSDSIHPVDCRCNRYQCKMDRVICERAQMFYAMSIASTNSTASNLPGPGRMLDNFCADIGVHVKHWICKVATAFGKGPEASEKALRRLLYGPSNDELLDTIFTLDFDKPEDIDRAHKLLETGNYSRGQVLFCLLDVDQF